jgi:hypothetical protein
VSRGDPKATREYNFWSKVLRARARGRDQAGERPSTRWSLCFTFTEPDESRPAFFERPRSNIKTILGSKCEGKNNVRPDLSGAIPERLKRGGSSRIVRAVAGKGTNDVRRCSRNGCRWPASASLTYAYAKKVVWIEDLTPQPHPAAYDLCAAHAERLAVPLGWAKEDLRVVPPAVTPIRPEVGTWHQADASAGA